MFLGSTFRRCEPARALESGSLFYEMDRKSINSKE
jgi:hypothetical protein